MTLVQWKKKAYVRSLSLYAIGCYGSHLNELMHSFLYCCSTDVQAGRQKQSAHVIGNPALSDLHCNFCTLYGW